MLIGACTDLKELISFCSDSITKSGVVLQRSRSKLLPTKPVVLYREDRELARLLL
jgi:hypothetical protein